MNAEICPLSILSAQATRFFDTQQGALCQRVELTADLRALSPLPGEVVIALGKHSVRTALTLQPGTHRYLCWAPYDGAGAAQARLTLQARQSAVHTQIRVGGYRPWTVYVLADVCSDSTWVYDDEAQMRADDAALLDRTLDLMDQTAAQPAALRERYNLVHTRQVLYYLQRFPEKAERLFAAIRNGALTLSPFYNMCLTGCVSLEELIRQFYPARRLAEEHNLPLCCANHQETPAITWFTASLLADCSIPYLVKAVLPYECSWMTRRPVPPLLFWQGADGRGVWLRLRVGDYVEAAFLLAGLRQTNAALHERILPSYEQLGGAYPFDAVALLGVYGDLSPESWRQVEKKNAAVAAYHQQGWEYPRLVNAAQMQFWEHLGDALQTAGLARWEGDFGAAWEAWPASLASLTARWRQVQERARQTDALTALCSVLHPPTADALRQPLEEAWENLLCLADHAWNGENDANRALNLRLRRQWLQRAEQGFGQTADQALSSLCAHIRGGKQEEVAVFNPLPWQRSDLVSVAVLGEGAWLVDSASGEHLPHQFSEGAAWFLTPQLPPLGYRTFAVARRQTASLTQRSWFVGEDTLQGEFYRLQVNPQCGAVRSLYDLRRGVELVDTAHGYCLGEAVYLCDGVRYSPRLESVRPGEGGALFADLITRSVLPEMELTTTFRLYAHLDRVDITCRLRKAPYAGREELAFAFPFALANCQARCEIPGVILDPPRELLPLAGWAYFAIRRFVHLFTPQLGVTLAPADSYLIKFGDHPLHADPPPPDRLDGLVMAVALQNCVDWDEAIRDQGGETDFTFRFSLRAHEGGEHTLEALQFAYQMNNGPQARLLFPGQEGNLPRGAFSPLEITPPQVVLTALKPAEAGGVLLRLWNPAAQEVEAQVGVALPLRIAAAWQTDALERRRRALDVEDRSRLGVHIAARSLASLVLDITVENRV
ncbi:MAG: hypothetical protein HPY45_14955 [Anaerolineae bacterium]|nr:hypothetical protein [Anaerolineae bacterium]